MSSKSVDYEEALYAMGAKLIYEGESTQLEIPKGVGVVDKICALFEGRPADLKSSVDFGEDSYIVTLVGEKHREFSKRKNREEKEGIEYDDTIDPRFADGMVLTHTTTLENWIKIQEMGKILSREKQGNLDNQVMTPRGEDSDGTIVYCEVHHRGDVLPPTDKNSVTLILHPNLLKERDDFYACQVWSYGPFVKHHVQVKYFGPKIRALSEYDTIPKREVVASVNTYFKTVLKYYPTLLPIPIPNEVGFLQEIPLDGHLITVLKPTESRSNMGLTLHYTSVAARAALRYLTSFCSSC